MAVHDDSFGDQRINVRRSRFRVASLKVRGRVRGRVRVRVRVTATHQC